jgi:hypothetical protein
LQYRNSGAQDRRELLIEKKKITGLDARRVTRASTPRKGGDAATFRRLHGEDAETFGFKSCARFADADCLNRPRHQFARRRS